VSDGGGARLRPAKAISFLRNWARRLPTLRAIARNWPLWALRQLFRPVLSVPLWVETRVGTRFYLGGDAIDDSILRHVMVDAVEIYFPQDAIVAPGQLIVDAGAHHGIYATEALRRNPGARLLAIEPRPAARAYFERNLSANGMLDRVEYVEAGLGDPNEEGFLSFGDASWYDSTVPDLAGARSSAGVPVRIVSLADILAGRRPSLVKLNAEGAEFYVIPELFERGIFPEWLVLMVHLDRGSGAELIGLVEQNGYEVVAADGQADSSRVHCRLRVSER
jgi:FkbM family methyltransferase